MTLIRMKKWLVTVWGIAFLVPLVLVIFQDLIYSKYGTRGSEVLGWLTALTLPTILLMVGAIVGGPSEEPEEEESDETKARREHNSMVFKWAMSISVVYLLIINGVFWIEPLSTTMKPLVFMGKIKIYLAVFDSLLAILLGYFFGKK